MSLEKLKKSYRSYRRLLESDTLGSFDFFTCIVCLDSIDSTTFKEFTTAKSTKSYLGLSKVIPLAVHELTHFIDSTSTVWGMNHLYKMNEAYCSNDLKGGKEYDFHKAKHFMEYVRSLRLPNYYTLIDDSKKPELPWESRITMGKQFNLDGKISESPILFSHFINVQGDLLARSPVSTVSILEASAMSNEILAKLSLINLLDKNERTVESSLYQKESLRYIYNQNLTEYSVCVHIIANHLQCKDLLIAFHICSTITRLVLNFPKALISAVARRTKIYEILNIPKDHEFEKRMLSGIKNQNLGILYFLICNALPNDTADSSDKMLAGIETALNRIGISLATLKSEAQKEIDEISAKLDGSKLNAIRILSKSGADNFGKIPLGLAHPDLSILSLPSVYLGDGVEVRIFDNESNILKKVSIEEIFEELYEGQEWVERFSEACTA